MEGFKPQVEKAEVFTREEAYAKVTPEHIQALTDKLSKIERTDNLYDAREQLGAVLKEFSFEIQLDNGNVVLGIPTTLHDSQVPPEVYEEWGKSAMEGKVQITSIKHILQSIDSHLRTSLDAPFNTEDFLAGTILLPVVAETIKRLFDDTINA